MDLADYLPRLTNVSSVLANDGLLDLIELELGDWLLLGNGRSVSQTLENLLEMTVEGPGGREMRVFRADRVTSHRNFRFKMTSAGQGRGGYARPTTLLRGHMYSPNRILDGNPSAVPIRLSLRLNLSRFIQAQPLGGPKKRADRRYQPPCLVIVPEERWFEKEWPFIPDTNLIIGSSFKHRYARSKHWSVHLAEYIQSILENFHEAVVEATSVSNIQFVHRPYVNLKRAEAYWEFVDENPIERVFELSHGLTAISSRSWTRDIEVYDVLSERRGLSRRVTIALSNGANLRVYPKTTQRLRFEVVFKSEGLQRLFGRHTADNIDALMPWLSMVVTNSAELLSATLQRLQSHQQQQAPFLSPTRLIHRICSSTEDVTISEALLASLVGEGSIALVDGSLFRRSVLRLVELQVLERTAPRSSVFVVRPPYQNALLQLQELGQTHL